MLQRLSEEKEESIDPETPKPNESGEGQKESVPDIIEEVFGVSNKELSDQDNIKIIIYEDSDTDETIGSFETLCMKIYRERHGSKPPYKLIENQDSLKLFSRTPLRVTVLKIKSYEANKEKFDFERLESGLTRKLWLKLLKSKYPINLFWLPQYQINIRNK